MDKICTSNLFPFNQWFIRPQHIPTFPVIKLSLRLFLDHFSTKNTGYLL